MPEFNSLSSFYNSKEWRQFRAMLIAERTNSNDGVLYSQHSGQPLLKAYDIVLHHIKPLTPINVNDFSVSLNPANILICSQKEHNEIHARFGFVAERKVYYVYGAPCAGKTTFVREIKGNSDIVVDMDSIWECITGGERYEKPNALKTNAFAVRDCLLEMVRTRAGKWERAFIIDGGAVKSDRERKIALYGAEAVFIDTCRDECIKRLHGDKKRLASTVKEWEKYIDTWFDNYTE